jgi:hypothetical protein
MVFVIRSRDGMVAKFRVKNFITKPVEEMIEEDEEVLGGS